MGFRKMISCSCLMAGLILTGIPTPSRFNVDAEEIHPRVAASRRVRSTARRREQEQRADQQREAVKVEPGPQRALIKALEQQTGQEVAYDEKTGVLIAERASGQESLFNRTLKLSKPNSEVRALQTYDLGDATAVDSRQVVVKFESDVSALEVNQALNLSGKVVQREPGNRYLVEVPAAKLTEDVVESLSNIEGVQYAQENRVLLLPPRPEPKGISPGPMPASTSAFPSDPHFSLQWNLENRGGPGTPNADIRIKPVWSAVKGTDKVKIAILDEGVDINHPDLKNKIIDPYDATKVDAHAKDERDDDQGQQPNSWDGHGTACAGVAAAISGNARGISGVAWDAKIIPIKIAKTKEKGGGWVYSDFGVATGILQAIARGADVINLSFGGRNWPSIDVRNAIENAITLGRGGKGAVIVVAAGNEGDEIADYFPACLAGDRNNPELPVSQGCLNGLNLPPLPIIVVGATNERDELVTVDNCSDPVGHKWGSNFGKEVTVVAPGINIPTTDNRGAGGFGSGDYITNFNATSSATPQVAGVAALLLAQHPEWTARQVKDRITATADNLGNPIPNDNFGFGRVNACRALGLPNCAGVISRSRPDRGSTLKLVSTLGKSPWK